VPILFATSPLAAIRSAPTITASISPRAINEPAIESVTSVTGIPSLASSHAVSLAPCKSGRVSQASTRRSRPRCHALRTMPSAVPHSAVASAPALQWVSTEVPGASSSAPAAPSAWQAAASDSIRSSATARARARTLPGAAPRASSGSSSARTRSMAHARFTAVGRVATSRLAARSRRWVSSVSGERSSSTAIPQAAASPIAGAPRTAICSIAVATASALSSDR